MGVVILQKSTRGKHKYMPFFILSVSVVENYNDYGKVLLKLNSYNDLFMNFELRW